MILGCIRCCVVLYRPHASCDTADERALLHWEDPTLDCRILSRPNYDPSLTPLGFWICVICHVICS